MGLVGYGSSDDEDDVESHTQVDEVSANVISTDESQITAHEDEKANGGANLDATTGAHPFVDTSSKSQLDKPLLGPSVGPTMPAVSDLPDDIDDMNYEEEMDADVPQSPYSRSRAKIRDLTLPSQPNLDIPPSPPGSPAQSTNAKFAHFLELKKKGVHFNEKLANSSALKNPSLMQKLMDFADISEEDQYSNTLPDNMWDSTKFPRWAYKEELVKSQQQVLKKREEAKARGQREAVEFVSASNDSSRSGTPGANSGVRVGNQSAAERIMAGLDRGRSGSPQVTAGVKRKTRFES